MPRSAAARADAGGRTSVEKGRGSGSAQCGSANRAIRRRESPQSNGGQKGGGASEKGATGVFFAGANAQRVLMGTASLQKTAQCESPTQPKATEKADAGRRSPAASRPESAAEAPPEAGAGSWLRMLRGENPRRKQAPRCATLPCAFSRLRKECRREWSRDWAGSPAHRRPPSPRAARHPRPCTLRGSCRTRRRKWRTRPRQ